MRFILADFRSWHYCKNCFGGGLILHGLKSPEVMGLSDPGLIIL